MEAKVDVRKLQILNDRINQTIEALNQVRLSVHGLAHAGIGTNPYQTQGYGISPGFGQGLGQGFGGTNPYLFGMQNPMGNVGGLGQLHNQLSQQGTGLGFPQGLGFQHSPFTNPLFNPYISQGVMNPWSQGQQIPFGVTPWTGLGGVAGGFGGGLFHSSPDVIDRQIAEVRASDPQRITQTFPFVSY